MHFLFNTQINQLYLVFISAKCKDNIKSLQDLVPQGFVQGLVPQGFVQGLVPQGFVQGLVKICIRLGDGVTTWLMS